MTRRLIPAVLAGLFLALAATAATAETKVVPAAQLFPFLDKFYTLAPADRSRFTLTYNLRAKDKSPVTATLIEGGAETPLPIAANGRVERLPTAAQLAAKAKVRVTSSSEYHVGMAPEALVKVGPEISVADLVAARDQLAAAVKRMAGVVSFVVPHFERAMFPRAEGAVAVGADGRETPLPVVRDAPTLDLAALKGVKAVRFTKPPPHVFLMPAGK